MNSPQVDRPSAWEDAWRSYGTSCHHSPTSSVEAHDSSVFTDSGSLYSSPATGVSITPPAPLRFTKAAKVSDNWTIVSGRLALKRPSWVPKNGRERALKTAFRAFQLSPDDVRHDPVPPLESVHITWRDIGRPGGCHRPIAIVSVTRPANICSRQPRTKTIILNCSNAPVKRTKIVFVKRKSCDDPTEPTAASSSKPPSPAPIPIVPLCSAHRAKRIRFIIKGATVSRSIRVKKEPTEETFPRLENIPLDSQAGAVENLIRDEDIKTEPQ